MSNVDPTKSNFQGSIPGRLPSQKEVVKGKAYYKIEKVAISALRNIADGLFAITKGPFEWINRSQAHVSGMSSFFEGLSIISWIP